MTVLPLLTALLAALVAVYLAPPIIAAAHRYGILDVGDGHLKEQKQPVAYLGGLVVFIAMLVALSVTQTFDARLLALLLGASLVVSVGLVDDLGTLTPKDKLLGQVLAAVVLVKGGIVIELTAVPEWVAALASIVWIVAVVNAFNIIDVSDGLCASVGAVAALVLGGWHLYAGALPEAFLCAGLAGGLVGFLRYNWSPAKMYLGDTGSMLVGVVLAAATMLGGYSQRNELAPLVTPLAVLVVPLFDLAFVVVVRLRLGLRIYHGSPDHFAVRLRRHGRSARAIAIGAMAVTCLAAAAGFLAALSTQALAAAIAGGGLAVCLVAGVVLWRVDPRAPAAPLQRAAVAVEPAARAPETAR